MGGDRTGSVEVDAGGEVLLLVKVWCACNHGALVSFPLSPNPLRDKDVTVLLDGCRHR